MAKKDKPIWVRWCAKDALDGMGILSPLEELAYRRVLDLIFVSDDHLVDDDRAMAWMTKAGRQWKAIKKRLLDLGKITVEDGFIRNARASDACTESRDFVAQKVKAGAASAEARKSLKTPDTRPTDVPTPVATDVPADVPTNQQSQEEESSLPLPDSVPATRPGPKTCRLDTTRTEDWKRWADGWEPGHNANARKEPLCRAPWQMFGDDPDDPQLKLTMADHEFNFVSLCRTVCRKAGLPADHEADWTPVWQWVHAGATDEQIAAGVERGADFASERGIAIASLGFFTKFILGPKEERAA